MKFCERFSHNRPRHDRKSYIVEELSSVAHAAVCDLISSRFVSCHECEQVAVGCQESLSSTLKSSAMQHLVQENPDLPASFRLSTGLRNNGLLDRQAAIVRTGPTQENMAPMTRI